MFVSQWRSVAVTNSAHGEMANKSHCEALIHRMLSTIDVNFAQALLRVDRFLSADASAQGRRSHGARHHAPAEMLSVLQDVLEANVTVCPVARRRRVAPNHLPGTAFPAVRHRMVAERRSHRRTREEDGL